MAVDTISAQEVDVFIRLAQDQKQLEQECLDLCKNTLPGWRHLKLEDVKFSKVTGGISNILLRAKPPSHLEPVCIKVFGDKTELLIDRELERTVVKDLSEQGFGPKVLVLFGNGRVEEFLYCKTLQPPEMCMLCFVPRIARLLARFHAAAVSLPRKPTLWTTIRHWLSMARSLSFDDPAKQAAYSSLNLAAMEREVDETEAACSSAHSPVVFGHCDLLAGNIVVLQQHGFDSTGDSAADNEGRLQLIDFEYGAYTYRGFDFGNHFNEYAGFECDYTRYPNRKQQELFFRHYIAEASTLQASTSSITAANTDSNCSSRHNGVTSTSGSADDGAEADLNTAELDGLCAEADVFALASHIYWGVWAIVQARYSPIDFDYMGYSRQRWGEYHRRKTEFIKEAKRVFGTAAC